MAGDIPDFIVHHSRGEPFRSITSVSHHDLDGVLKKMNEGNAWGLARFSDPQYLSQRYQTEEILKDRFIKIGGKPDLENPIYFFLGRHHSFEEQPLRVYRSSLLIEIFLRQTPYTSKPIFG